jgi:FkbM family methyltransferase
VLGKLKSRLGRVWRGVNKFSVRAVSLPMLGGVTRSIPIVTLGTGEGQWDIPANLIDDTWTCYSVGIGTDASFDVELVKQFRCKLFSFDPTPASVEYVRSLEPVEFRFIPWAIWINDGHLDFFSQDLNNKVNLSLIDSGRGEHLCRVECFRLQTVMKRLEHSSVDLLKIDIEGAWLPVIEDFVSSGISPKVFCVEFDSPTSLRKVRRAVRLLATVGLTLVHRHRDNYLFVQQSILEKLR